MSESSNWKVYDGCSKTPKGRVESWLSQVPPWRQRSAEPLARLPPAMPELLERRGLNYRLEDTVALDRINVALMLRRPVLVTGRPGIGKSSLAYSIAWALGLGPPLRWEINSQTTLRDGLYQYDPVAHLRASQSGDATDIGHFITLGPLGTALLPTHHPRVLLVDELDKSSYDLPNDLLHVFEEGAYSIPELMRDTEEHLVLPHDADRSKPQADWVPIRAGSVSTLHHPVMVITSNGERDFPEAFIRRCVPVALERPSDTELSRIIALHLPGTDSSELETLLARHGDQATDFFLQLLFASRGFGVPLDTAASVLRRGRE